MNDPAWLAEIKRDIERGGDDNSWPTAAVRELVGEVERLRRQVNHLNRLRWSDHGGELGDEPWVPPYPGTPEGPPPP